MNKMNLPPPFEELEEEFPMLKEVYNMEKYKNIFGNVVASKGRRYWSLSKVDCDLVITLVIKFIEVRPYITAISSI